MGKLLNGLLFPEATVYADGSVFLVIAIVIVYNCICLFLSCRRCSEFRFLTGIWGSFWGIWGDPGIKYRMNVTANRSINAFNIHFRVNACNNMHAFVDIIYNYALQVPESLGVKNTEKY